jgi:hypothetical protein
MNISVLSPIQWGMIFILLSMDVITPFWEAMGLRLRDSKYFQNLLRSLIIENRKIYEQDPETIPPLAARVFEQLESLMGKSESESLYKWATNIYNEVHADQPQWSAWEIIFFRAAYNAQIKKQLGLPEEEIDSILSKYKKDLDTADVEQKIESLKTKPLSDWDLEMYSIHQFHNDDLNNPFDLVLRFIRMNRFQNFWEGLLQNLSEDEKVILHQNGQEIIKEMGVWLPENEELVLPDNLRKGL